MSKTTATTTSLVKECTSATTTSTLNVTTLAISVPVSLAVLGVSAVLVCLIIKRILKKAQQAENEGQHEMKGDTRDHADGYESINS